MIFIKNTTTNTSTFAEMWKAYDTEEEAISNLSNFVYDYAHPDDIRSYALLNWDVVDDTYNTLTFSTLKEVAFCDILNKTSEKVLKTDVSELKTDVSDIKVDISNIKIENNLAYYFQKILAIGDSLTHGDYGSYPEGTPNDKPWNYPYYLSKLTNATVVNNGYDGYRPTSMWKNRDSKISKDNDFDLILIYLGTNGQLYDTIDTAAPGDDYNNYNTDSSDTGAYCALIAWLKEQKPKAKIMLINFHYGRNGVEWSNSRSAVLDKIAKKFELPVLDIMRKSPFLSTLENAKKYRPVGIDEEIAATGSSNGNLHFGRLGYLTLALTISNLISDEINTNPEKYALGY